MITKISAGAALVVAVGVVTPLTVPVSVPEVAAAGSRAAMPYDFDGDGFADMAVGVVTESIGKVSEAGAVQVLYGSASGPTARDQLWHRNRKGVKGVAQEQGFFGGTTASGDFDRDGFADLAVGETFGHGGTGKVQVLYGGSKGLTARDQMWHQDTPGFPGRDEPGERFGWSLAVGDFDADGFADLAIGVPYEVPGSAGTSPRGRVVVLRGSGSGLTTSGVQSLAPGAVAGWRGDYFGLELAAGDFNADGSDDLLVVGGDPEEVRNLDEDPDAARALYVLPGSSAGLTGAGSRMITRVDLGLPAPDGYVAFTRPVAGDFNGDGRDDLAVSASPNPVVIMYSTSDGLVPTGAQIWAPPGASLDYVADLAAGDLFGDGADELVVGKAADYGQPGIPEFAGAVYVLAGSPAGLAPEASVLTQNTPGIPGADEAGDRFGSALRVLSGRSGSGVWLAIGVAWEGIGSVWQAGRVIVVPGAADGLAPSDARAWHQNKKGIKGRAETGDQFGWQL